MYMKKLRLDGRTAVVTGGGRGIGLACAEALAEAGATLVLADLSEELIEAGVAHLTGLGFTATGHVLDVTDSAATEALADELVRRHGRIDILVANAGIGRPSTPAEQVSDADWLAVHDVNLNGVFWCDRAFGRHMLAAGGGAIVNIGSMSGDIVNRPQKQAAYNASKAAVHHLTKSLAAEWADRNVRVNAVAPTYITTPLTRAGVQNYGTEWLRDTPMGRFGEPDEIASVVHFLASDAASLMTGSIVTADAGLTLW